MKQKDDIKGKWGVSSNNETFTGDYASKEEAIDLGADEELCGNLESPNDGFYVGLYGNRSTVALYSSDIIDTLQERAYDNIGELTEDFLHKPTKELIELIDAKCNEISLIIAEHDPINWWPVNNISEHQAKESKLWMEGWEQQ